MRHVPLGCNPGKLSQCQLQALIPQHWSEQTCPAHFLDIESRNHKVLFKILRLRHHLSRGADDHGASREVRTIFKTDPVDVNVEHRVKLRSGFEQVFPALRGCKQRTLANATSGAAGDRDHGFGTILSVQVDGGRVPKVFADQETQFTELCLKRAEILPMAKKRISSNMPYVGR